MTLGTFLEISKAFDYINYEILPKPCKLNKYGIHGVPLSLIKSYLSLCKQCVLVHSYPHEYQSITSGVSQGSILGPLLFDLYINYIVIILYCSPYF